jgi:hypothetical protein
VTCPVLDPKKTSSPGRGSPPVSGPTEPITQPLGPRNGRREHRGRQRRFDGRLGHEPFAPRSAPVNSGVRLTPGSVAAATSLPRCVDSAFFGRPERSSRALNAVAAARQAGIAPVAVPRLPAYAAV